jgi:hypothetical protein
MVALLGFQNPADVRAQDVSNRARHDFPPVGLVPGQTLRITVASLGELTPGPVQPDRVRLFLLDARGQRIADSGPRELAAAQMEWLSVERNRLPAGEPGTGRLQVRAVVVSWNPEGLPPSPVRPSVEVLNAAGRTLVFLPPSPILPPGPTTPPPGE